MILVELRSLGALTGGKAHTKGRHKAVFVLLSQTSTERVSFVCVEFNGHHERVTDYIDLQRLTHHRPFVIVSVHNHRRAPKVVQLPRWRDNVSVSVFIWGAGHRCNRAVV